METDLGEHRRAYHQKAQRRLMRIATQRGKLATELRHAAKPILPEDDTTLLSECEARDEQVRNSGYQKHLHALTLLQLKTVLKIRKETHKKMLLPVNLEVNRERTA
jgi:hypothetical protein